MPQITFSTTAGQYASDLAGHISNVRGGMAPTSTAQGSGIPTDRADNYATYIHGMPVRLTDFIALQ